jgi:hypothetical protein
MSEICRLATAERVGSQRNQWEVSAINGKWTPLKVNGGAGMAGDVRCQGTPGSVLRAEALL